MTARKKLLLIDGHGLLFQMFFGMPREIKGRNGQPVQGVIGFIGALLKSARLIRPDNLLIIFDSEVPCFRNSMRPEYKSNRQRDFSKADDSQNPFTQLPIIQTALDELGCKHCEAEGVEADDLIAAYAAAFQNSHDIVIWSADSDLLQLVNDRVTIFRYRGKASSFCDRNEFENKYGFSPELMADYKALRGDSADGLPGVPGVGHETARKIIRHYGPLEQLYQNLAQMPSGKMKQKLIAHRELVSGNYGLIKLRADWARLFTPDDLAVNPQTFEHKTMVVLDRIKAI